MSQAASGPPIVEQFGHYGLVRKIGQGGMAEVFLAIRDDAIPGSPPLVIKRMHQELEKDRDSVDLFLTEADVTLMLEHPNLIRVHDSGEINGRYYMCMEYVHGKDLEQIFARFQQKQIPVHPDMACFMVSAMLRGLHYAHHAKTPTGRELGLVHRDVTPSNVFINAQGGIKLGDFGVAKLVGVESWTMAGSIKGKLGYLSPEQVAGDAPAQSIDLWAAAVILYELLSGQRLFVGDNELDIMLRIKSAKVPKLRKINKSAPRALQKVLQKALHKKEKKRYATAGDFADALDEYTQKHGELQMSPPSLVQYLTSALS